MATNVKMRKYKLNVFSVVMNESSTNFPLANRVFGALKKAGKAKERLIYLNKGESGDVDLVAKFQLSEDFLFGTFVRLNNTRDSILKLSDLENDEVEIEKIIALARDDSAGTVKSISYFGLYGHTLVLENAKNTLKALKVYISSFLDRSGEPDIQLEFVQKGEEMKSIAKLYNG